MDIGFSIGRRRQQGCRAWTLLAVMGVGCLGVPALAAQPPIVSGAPEPDPAAYKPTVVSLFRDKLIDPDSATYIWSPPYQMTCRKGVYHTSDRWKGWAVDVEVNAKNSYGGYTGKKPYTVIFTRTEQEEKTEVLDATIFWMFKSCRKEAWQ